MENGWVWVSERDGKGDFGFVKPFEKITERKVIM